MLVFCSTNQFVTSVFEPFFRLLAGCPTATGSGVDSLCPAVANCEFLTSPAYRTQPTRKMIAPTTVPYLIWFAGLAAACALLYYKQNIASPVQTSAEFKSFKWLFLSVYLIMMMADWMQGPYVYALYDAYGFSKGQIGQLFIMGFGSSMVFGTVVGGFADRYGRKANCLIFAVLYSISCVTKHFNDYNILMFGRLTGGISTSILYSAFETWMVHEHKSAGYADDWMNATFSEMTFGSGLVAIVAGLVASMLSSTFGYVAPFDGSLVLLVAGGAIIYTKWRENYGDTSRMTTGFDNFGKAWRLLMASEKVLLLGLIQSCFESAMYIFVFMWTPALESALAASGGSGLPHGLVFAGFMVCIMIGSKMFETLVGMRPVEHLTRWVFVVASGALALPILTSSHNVILAGFCVFEVCCGIYFPSAVSTLLALPPSVDGALDLADSWCSPAAGPDGHTSRS